ncbi:Helix-turn-helix domain-containing protein [Pedobacter suwonensis]|uniref:Helix-turn-helix domain-containing protein n=1 Tax=Pedobacter suwonensis TaxID=332999 RepID=A0A1I0SJN1_9SPHI|nr:helix-turn-helix transcriptional regulator [Pedobacter suwonensis]SFA39719.1 Helix-turn-helix domain-containing protein [Pedobacter suwonensis]
MEDVLLLSEKHVVGNIRKIREYRAYTQKYLATKLKISQNAYSKIEIGDSKLTIDRLFHIAMILNVEVANLLTLNQNDLIRIIADGNEKTAR